MFNIALHIPFNKALHVTERSTDLKRSIGGVQSLLDGKKNTRDMRIRKSYCKEVGTLYEKQHKKRVNKVPYLSTKIS